MYWMYNTELEIRAGHFLVLLSRRISSFCLEISNSKHCLTKIYIGKDEDIVVIVNSSQEMS